MAGLNSQNIDHSVKNCEGFPETNNDKKSVLSKTIHGVCALALAVTLNVADPKEAQAQTNSIPQGAISVELVQNGKLTDIPFGARKINYRNGEFFVWKKSDGTFSMQITKMDEASGTDDIHFEANVGGENYVFSIVGEDTLDQVMIAEKSPDRQSVFGIDYNELVEGNYILKNIMLSSEQKLADYYKTLGHDDARIKRTLEGIAGIMNRDRLAKPQYEAFKNAYPEILTSFSFLDQNKYPNLYVIGELESNTQQAQNATQQAQNLIEVVEQGERILNKLGGNN